MDLASIASALGCTVDDITECTAETVTTRDGVVHTFADPTRFGLEPWKRPAEKSVKPAPAV